MSKLHQKQAHNLATWWKIHNLHQTNLNNITNHTSQHHITMNYFAYNRIHNKKLQQTISDQRNTITQNAAHTLITPQYIEYKTISRYIKSHQITQTIAHHFIHTHPKNKPHETTKNPYQIIPKTLYDIKQHTTLNEPKLQ